MIFIAIYKLSIDLREIDSTICQKEYLWTDNIGVMCVGLWVCVCVSIVDVSHLIDWFGEPKPNAFGMAILLEIKVVATRNSIDFQHHH